MKNIDRQGKSWRVRFMRNGMKINRSFNTKSEAEAYLQRWKKSNCIGMLSSAQIAEATVAYEKLNGLSLLKAVDFYLVNAVIGADAPKISVGVERYIEELKKLGRSDSHVWTMRNKLKGFAAHYGDMKPAQVTSACVRDWIATFSENNAWNSTTKLAAIDAVRAWFGWALRQGWLRELPVIDDKDIVRGGIKAPEFYTAAKMRGIFDVLETKYPQVIPHYAVRAFFGLRTSEANRLTWNDVDLKARILRVRATNTRTGIARTLDATLVPETGFKWLRAYFDKGLSSFRVQSHLGAQIYADFPKALDSGFRKSFVTMFTSLTNDPQKTLAATGQTSLTLLRRHYEATKQPKAEADAYFAVLPTRKKKKA